MPLTADFFRHTGDADATPHPRVPGDVAPEHGAPLGPSEASRLRQTVTAIDLHAGRVHDDVLHPLGYEPAVEPAPLPARLIATADAGVIGSSTPLRGPSDLLMQARDSTRRHRALPRPLRRPGREAKFPGRDAECKSQTQGRPRCRCLILAGCHWSSRRWTPACVVQPMGFADVCRSFTPAALVRLVPLQRISCDSTQGSTKGTVASTYMPAPCTSASQTRMERYWSIGI
jgi:hypothetical protein